MGEIVNAEVVNVTVSNASYVPLLKGDMPCWPALDCKNPREWAVFHDAKEAALPFDYLASVYIGCCSEHLPLALRRDPAAINFVRPY